MSCKSPSRCTVAIWTALAAREPNAVAEMIRTMRTQGGLIGVSDSEAEDWLAARALRKLAA